MSAEWGGDVCLNRLHFKRAVRKIDGRTYNCLKNRTTKNNKNIRICWCWLLFSHFKYVRVSVKAEKNRYVFNVVITSEFASMVVYQSLKQWRWQTQAHLSLYVRIVLKTLVLISNNLYIKLRCWQKIPDRWLCIAEATFADRRSSAKNIMLTTWQSIVAELVESEVSWKRIWEQSRSRLLLSKSQQKS